MKSEQNSAAKVSMQGDVLTFPTNTGPTAVVDMAPNQWVFDRLEAVGGGKWWVACWTSVDRKRAERHVVDTDVAIELMYTVRKVGFRCTR